MVGFEAVKYYENWFFGPTKVCQAFSWLFIALPNLWMASSVFCCDSLRFLTHPYTKEPKFLLLNPKNIIPAKVHVRLRISSCNMFNRFSRPLARRKSYFVPYWGLYRDQAFQWCNIGTKETAFFDNIFGPKRNIFWSKKVLFILVTPCTIIWAAILWVWASSESYSKIAKRFSADQHTQRSWIFWSFLAQNAIFFH